MEAPWQVNKSLNYASSFDDVYKILIYRSLRDTKMTQFFGHNFTEDRWRKAALKNAFALLGKQRFEHSAAFFLLAGHLKDAVEVIHLKL